MPRDASSFDEVAGESMFRFGAWRIPIAALFALSFVLPRNLPAQASDQPQTPAAAPSATATTTPTRTPPTAEQLGDSLAARQRYQAAIAAYSKAPEMTAPIWNKMGIAYQMMFNSKDATRCYKQSLLLDPAQFSGPEQSCHRLCLTEGIWPGRPSLP